jgi:pSer/pThr/pTyr-binding forkhead associated (FHA) protein
MKAKLIEMGTNTSPDEKREIPITKEEFLIGRGDDCDLRLRLSSVSRHHCLLRVRGEEVTATDLGSINGTYLNGQRIRSQSALHSGDELQVGSYHFFLEVGEGPGIEWRPQAGVDPAATTYRLGQIQQMRKELEKERGHPPGEAGGQGDSAGKESG